MSHINTIIENALELFYQICCNYWYVKNLLIQIKGNILFLTYFATNFVNGGGVDWTQKTCIPLNIYLIWYYLSKVEICTQNRHRVLIRRVKFSQFLFAIYIQRRGRNRVLSLVSPKDHVQLNKIWYK